MSFTIRFILCTFLILAADDEYEYEDEVNPDDIKPPDGGSRMVAARKGEIKHFPFVVSFNFLVSCSLEVEYFVFIDLFRSCMGVIALAQDP